MKDVGRPGVGVDRDSILDRIYDIALDPEVLEDFIELWAENDPLGPVPDDFGAQQFDDVFGAHLERAIQFLQHETGEANAFEDVLRPYEGLAAFVVDTSLVIKACNRRASEAFGIGVGDPLHRIGFGQGTLSDLTRLTHLALQKSEGTDRFLRIEGEDTQPAKMLRVVRIAPAQGAESAALILSAHFQWREPVARVLQHAYGLSTAEQAVVRLLAEGQTVRSIAKVRGTSEGTVRGQIKSTLQKMNLRSQVDIVRFVLTLGVLPDAIADKWPVIDVSANTNGPTSGNWIEAEVWKPFAALTLPDGRRLTYHDIGPRNGNPVLLSHMGSCMVRWPGEMVKKAYALDLRVLCPIRAGYGQSDALPLDADVFASTSADVAFLLAELGLSRLPYAVQGTDFPLAADLATRHPDLISEIIGIGGRPCLPGGVQIEGEGLWQRFFVRAARHNPKLLEFASGAVVAMSRRIGPEAMLGRLCKESPADLDLLERPEVLRVLAANIAVMAEKSGKPGRAFAQEYLAFHSDWSGRMQELRDFPMRIFLADQDPTFDIDALPELEQAYPWIGFEVVPDTGLALLFQRPDMILPLLAEAARKTAEI